MDVDRREKNSGCQCLPHLMLVPVWKANVDGKLATPRGRRRLWAAFSSRTTLDFCMEDDNISTESIGLLHLSEAPNRHERRQRPGTWNPNPLPWGQLSVVLFGRVCDALASQSIQPYINQVRTILGGSRSSTRRNSLMCSFIARR